MSFRNVVLVSLLLLVAACRSIPEPLAQVEQKASDIGTLGGLTSPMQKAWEWDSERWFEASVDHSCFGELRFVDRKNGINSFMAFGYPPQIVFVSDDRDVVLGTTGRDDGRLVFSTDGGRRFVKEVRRLPRNGSVEFIEVRKGYVYVGFHNGVTNPDGYFSFKSAEYLPFGGKTKIRDESKLVILEARLDKARARIGQYMLLAPKDYQFQTPMPESAQAFIKRVDYIDTLNLPRVGTSGACRAMEVPVWHNSWTREDLNEFVAWYEKTKQAHPGWANAKKEMFVEKHLEKHKNNR